MATGHRTAVIFGGSGAIGGAVAETLAQEGCTVVVVARSEDRLQATAERIRGGGGDALHLVADALDMSEVGHVMGRIATERGGIDIVVNATGFLHDQGKTIEDLSLDEFNGGITPFLGALFNISKAAARHMGGERPGVFVTVVAPAAKMAMPGHLGHIVGCAGTEAFCKALASELGPRNIRVVCVRSHAISDAIAAGSHTKALFAPKAAAMGISLDEWLGGAAGSTMLNRLPALSEIAGTVAFLASDSARCITGTVVNVTAGGVVD